MSAAEEYAELKSPAEELRERFWNLKKSRIRMSPVHTTRASSLGEDCERRLVYERTAWQMRTPHPPELQAIFDLGNELEPYVIRELEALGAKVVQRGKDYHDAAHDLTGHVDAKLEIPGIPKLVPTEIKGLNPFTAGTISTIYDIRGHKDGWVRKYYSQLQTYLHLDKSDLGLFALLNKVSGAIQFIDCPLDEEFAKGLLAKADRIRDAVRSETLPERHLTQDCDRCPFLHVCLPDRSYGPGAQFLDNAELEAMLKRRSELDPLRKEYEQLDKAIKASLPQTEAPIVVGDWELKGKQIHKKPYEVKGTSFWQWAIRKLERSTK